MTTIKGMWEHFKQLSYPEGMVPEQERQIRNAFYSGVTRVLLVAVVEGTIDEEATADTLCAMMKESAYYHKDIILDVLNKS